MSSTVSPLRPQASSRAKAPDTALRVRIEDKAAAALALLQAVVAEFGPSKDALTFANSLGAEDIVVSDLILRHQLPIEIFSLDTGRLPVETYQLLDQLETHYQTRFKVLSPQAAAVEDYVARHGINGFYHSVEQRKACCEVRKLEPLRRALQGKQAWITGLRASQSVTRNALAVREFDEANGLVKLNPLADWSEAEVWAYIALHQLPYNALHDRFYPSIGCAPCTRAITPGEDIRAGRWWWENPATKECGLHVKQA